MPEAAAGPYLSDAQLSIFSPKPQEARLKIRLSFLFRIKPSLLYKCGMESISGIFFLISTPKGSKDNLLVLHFRLTQ